MYAKERPYKHQPSMAYSLQHVDPRCIFVSGFQHGLLISHAGSLTSPAGTGLNVTADQTVNLVGHCFLAVLIEMDPDKVGNLADGSL